MADEKTTEEAPAKKKKGKLAIIIPVVVLLLGMGGGGYFFMSSKSKKAEAAEATTTTTALGPLVRLDPITMNLSDGSVLKVGMALQFVAKPEDEHMAEIVKGLEAAGHGGGAKKGEGSPLGGEEAKALDKAIALLGDSTSEELSKPGGRVKAKEKLTEKVKESYHGAVINVYFTDFVMS